MEERRQPSYQKGLGGGECSQLLLAQALALSALVFHMDQWSGVEWS